MARRNRLNHKTAQQRIAAAQAWERKAGYDRVFSPVKPAIEPATTAPLKFTPHQRYKYGEERVTAIITPAFRMVAGESVTFDRGISIQAANFKNHYHFLLAQHNPDNNNWLITYFHGVVENQTIPKPAHEKIEDGEPFYEGGARSLLLLFKQDMKKRGREAIEVSWDHPLNAEARIL